MVQAFVHDSPLPPVSLDLTSSPPGDVHGFVAMLPHLDHHRTFDDHVPSSIILKWHPRLPSLNCEKGVHFVVSDVSLFPANLALGNYFSQSSWCWSTNTLRFCSVLAFIHSIWPSVCGWNAVDILRSFPRRLHIWPQNIDANWGPLSKTIVNGGPSRCTTSFKDNSANPGASIIVWQAMKCWIFKSQFATTQIAWNQSHSSNPTTQSMEMSSYGIFITGKGGRTPKVEWLERRDHWQLWQFCTY